MLKTRYLEQEIKDLCFTSSKMAFISGPRQCGKTTMAQNLLAERKVGQYYNWDETKFRRLWTKDPASVVLTNTDGTSAKPLIVLDEIHKAKLWKRNLKGVYDTQKQKIDFLITGSAKLNVYRKGSDSLQGRYYHFCLHPFSLAELLSPTQHLPPQDLIKKILSHQINHRYQTTEYFQLLDKFGPFPEPLLAASQKKLNLWHRGRTEKIVREDLRDLSHLPELSQVEMLISLLPERAANVLSIQSLSEDLEVAYTTTKRWLTYLYQLYYAFKVPPYFKSLSHSLKKECKLYLWDWSEIHDESARFENLIACHLLKYCDYLSDTGEGNFQLYYLRNKQKKEIDFLIVKDRVPWLPVEVKLNDDQLTANWATFLKQLPCEYGIQVVKNNSIYRVEEKPFGKVIIISAEQFLSHLV